MSLKGSETVAAPVKYMSLDIVGYTENRGVEAQSSIIDVLNECVRAEIERHRSGRNRLSFFPPAMGFVWH